MSTIEASRNVSAEAALVAAAQAGEESAFTVLVERYRPELQVHCYRMLGSLEDAEDLVQETFLRAWRKRASFQARSSFRAWLYRIATNACLDALERRPRRVVAPQVAPARDPTAEPLPPVDLPWLQPYPDRLLDAAGESEAEPGAALVSKETIELAFLAAIQHLPPRQRAVLILRDALSWSASETASLLDASVPAVNSALQRARGTLEKHLPARRLEWARSSDPDEEERSLLQRYMDAWERADVAGLVALLREGAQMTMPPTPTWYDGREAIATFFSTHVFGDAALGHKLLVPTRANRQPAFAVYVRREGESEYLPLALMVLRIEGGLIAAIDGFVLPELFPSFGLAPSM